MTWTTDRTVSAAPPREPRTDALTSSLVNHKTPKDYADSGMDIQSAMLDVCKGYPSPARAPHYIYWRGREIQTALRIQAPKRGLFRLTFLTRTRDIDQGVDVAADGGIRLAGGEVVETLRTWKDDIHEDEVEYEYVAHDGVLWVWNVYRWHWPSGRVTEEKWTGNAGFWVERPGPDRYVLHCSPGPPEEPDFGSLVVEIAVEPIGATTEG